MVKGRAILVFLTLVFLIPVFYIRVFCIRVFIVRALWLAARLFVVQRNGVLWAVIFDRSFGASIWFGGLLIVVITTGSHHHDANFTSALNPAIERRTMIADMVFTGDFNSG